MRVPPPHTAPGSRATGSQGPGRHPTYPPAGPDGICQELGIKLVVEVLDHYRGPDHKFRWLVAFAENAADKTRTGWPGRELMAWRTRTSPNRVSHVARQLIDDGILERAGAAGRGRGKA